MALYFVILSVLLAGATAEVVKLQTCNGVSQDHCSVTLVNITPCKKEPCTLPRSQNTSLSFDFTPNFSTSNLKTMVYNNDMEFPGFGSDDACEYTTCPTEPGVSQTFNYELYISPLLPKGTYTIVWKVWNGDNTAQVCCFKAGIKLKKPANK